jgi:Flp pilus assembly protein TadG
MPNLSKRFLKSEHGSFVPALAVAMVPLIAAVGMAIDYSAGVAQRNAMQVALDAASLASMTLPRDLTTDERRQKLQSVYEMNGGKGTVTLGAYDVSSTGRVTMSASATYDMPTDFMSIVGVDTVAIGVEAAARKNPALVSAAFKIDKVSGYWNKTMTLFGTKFGASKEQPLLKIDYTYNGGGGDKGYGTTIVSKITENPNFPNDRTKDLTTQVQKQVCTTQDKSAYTTTTGKGKNATTTTTIPAGAIVDGSKITLCTTTATDDKGAEIDVSQMDKLYLQMDVPSGNPKKLKTNDPATSNRMYTGKGYTTAADKAAKPADYLPVEVPTNQLVDIFNAVPCGQTSDQAWEDGGNAVPAPVSNADFFYSVSGKCDFSQRASETALTQ